MIPRPYQSSAVTSILHAFKSGIRRTLCLSCTGSGKTVIAGLVAKAKLNDGRVLFYAHRDELLKQAANKLESICEVIPVFEKANEYSPEDSTLIKPPVVISSVQTLNAGGEEYRRMMRLAADEFALVITDEGHRSVANSYQNVIDHFSQNTQCCFLFLTATSDRPDERGLIEVVQHVAFKYELNDAIADGYLVPIRQRRVFIDGLEFAKVGTSGDDFTQGELEQALLVEKPLHGVVQATIETACGLPIGYLETIRDDENRVDILQQKINGLLPQLTLMFAVTVDHAERLAEIVNRWIPGSAAFICGDKKRTPTDERARILGEFRAGKIRFLSNVDLMSEGVDVPNIEIVAMSALTKSRIKYSQRIGRGTRPLESVASLLGECTESAERREIIAKSPKPHLVVLDFSGNSGIHKLISTVDILGVSRPQRVLDRANELIDAEGMDAQEAIEAAGRDIEAEQAAEAALAEIDAEIEDESDQQMVSAAAMRRMNLVGTANYRMKNVSAFDRPDTAPQINPNAASPTVVKSLVDMGVRPDTAAAYKPQQAGKVLKSMRNKKLAGWQANRLRQRGMTDGQLAGMNYYDGMRELYPRE